MISKCADCSASINPDKVLDGSFIAAASLADTPRTGLETPGRPVGMEKQITGGQWTCLTGPSFIQAIVRILQTDPELDLVSRALSLLTDVLNQEVRTFHIQVRFRGFAASLI